jgi:phytoene dehydrogenase-like protein
MVTLTPNPDVIVVGAGHNGLTAGCYLAKAHKQVLILEAGSRIGGMTATNAIIPEAPQHLFNEGAIQLTGIFRLSGVAEELELHKYGLREIPVDPAHIQLAPDGSSLAIWKDASKTADELRHFSPKDARAWLDMSNAMYHAMGPVIEYMKVHPTRPFSKELLKQTARSVPHLRKMWGLKHIVGASHFGFLDETFETELPKGALSAMAAFSQLKLDMTAWAMIYLGIVQRVANAMPVGGTGALPKALEQCFLAHGGQVRVNAPVAELILEGDRVVGVTLESGEKIRAKDGVMATCNPVITLNRLLPAGTLDRKLDARAKDIPIRKTHATSLKINVATSGKISMEKHRQWRKDKLDPTGILVAWATLEEQSAAWDMTVRGEWYHPMPVHCSIVPSRVDPTQAPADGDTFWLWSGIPPVNPITPWEQVRDEVGRSVLKDAAQYYIGLDTHEIGRAVLCGPDLEKRFNAPAGNVYHVDPLITRFGPMRPAPGFGSYRTPVPGLYLSGAGTHPTGGVCSLPGKLAAQTFLADLAKPHRAKRS